MLNARIAVLVQASLGILVLMGIASLQGMAISERWKSMRGLKKRADRSLAWLFLMAVLGVGFYFAVMLMYAVDWSGKDDQCRLFGRPFIPILFFISKQCLYMFLYERSCVVHESLRLNRGRFIVFRRAVAAFIILGIP